MTSPADQHSILIVDDNPTNLEVLSEALSEAGFEVAVAIDGESALEQVSYYPPSLILLDIMMPGMDGFETCQRLKENPQTFEIPVIFMTALSDTKDKVKGLSLGAVDYITKPFQYEEVMARVQVHLDVQNLTQTLKRQNQSLKTEIEQRKIAEHQLAQANCALEDFNHQLEVSVAERTQELSAALLKVKNTQMELVQREKLSALGQLVAGIAHEINNPVNFIHGNVVHAREYTQELLELVALYTQHYPQPASEIQQQREKIDIDFLSEDLPKLLRSMEVGTERILSIVLSLRIFSRLDEADVKDVDLHECLDSTLLILNSRIKSRTEREDIALIREYSELPRVKCYPGQLNQVFMNILSNAIDALDEQNEKNSDADWFPQIQIKTSLEADDKVKIRIIDNGIGIPEALKQKVFDPFFTTKAVGKGTGLGMSISHEIITKKHHGSFLFQPASPRGTEFIITIPTFQDVHD
ncbi:MAG: response regulator [Phormidesmis sp.]